MGHQGKLSSPLRARLGALSYLTYNQTWTLLVQLDRVEDPVTGCVWAPDSKTFTLGTLDKQRSLRTFNLKGEVVHDWGRRHRTQDLCGSPDGRWLVAIDEHRKIHVYNGNTRELEYEMELPSTPTSVSVSQDSKHLLVNKNDGEAQYINLVTRKLVHKFLGHTGGECLIRANFGGSSESFVVSGSEGKPARNFNISLHSAQSRG